MDSSKESKLWVRHTWERGTHPALASGPPSSEVPGRVSVPWSGNLATVNISLYIDGWVGWWMNDWVDDRWMD